MIRAWLKHAFENGAYGVLQPLRRLCGDNGAGASSDGPPAGLGKTASDQLRIEIDGDHDIGAQSARNRHRYRVDQSAIDQPAICAVILCWTENTGHGYRSAHGPPDRALL